LLERKIPSLPFRLVPRLVRLLLCRWDGKQGEGVKALTPTTHEERGLCRWAGCVEIDTSAITPIITTMVTFMVVLLLLTREEEDVEVVMFAWGEVDDKDEADCNDRSSRFCQQCLDLLSDSFFNLGSAAKLLQVGTIAAYDHRLWFRLFCGPLCWTPWFFRF